MSKSMMHQPMRKEVVGEGDSALVPVGSDDGIFVAGTVSPREGGSVLVEFRKGVVVGGNFGSGSWFTQT